ncbi:MAG: hypothetical protein JO227_15085 [Acetobacteraceae bacterium]|nr:hypothetical protein [Acetobacteraceae bacterium]
MIDPLGDEPPCFVQGRLGVVDAIKRGAGLEGAHVVRAKLAKVPIRGHNSSLAVPGDSADVMTHW